MIFYYIDFLFDSFHILLFKYSKSFLLLLFILYMLRRGKREKFEIIFLRSLQCLHYFLIYRFSFILKKIDIIVFLNSVYRILFIDFKLLMKNARKQYFLITFEMLMGKHKCLYQKKISVLDFILNIKKKKTKKYDIYMKYLKSLKLSKKKMSKKKKNIKSITYRYLRVYVIAKNKMHIKNKKRKKLLRKLQISKAINVYPLSVSVNYKRLKSFVLLFKCAFLQKHLSFILNLSCEILMTFFRCSLSCYIKHEMVKIACSNKSNVRF